jgi:hypothetical protein
VGSILTNIPESQNGVCVCVRTVLCFPVASHTLISYNNENVNSKVNLSLGLIKRDALTIYRTVEVWLHEFLPLALDGGKWSASGLSHFTPGERAPHPRPV